MEFSELTVQAEEKYLSSLESFFSGKWGDTQICSHNLDHHRRVWEYAKELLECPDIYKVSRDQSFIDKLLIACYLHDLGMALDKGERHGRFSKDLCVEFLNERKDGLEEFSDLLFAIEHHDNKNYTILSSASPLLLMLSAADDLDAFGFTGIYRYLEIYIMRGIRPENIGPRVLENSEARFANFERNFSNCSDLVEKHRNRYQILRDFFINFSREQKENNKL
jgi:hypothetical protein